MTDPATMSVAEIEVELREANRKLVVAREDGGKIAEFEGRVWRLLFEKRYRQRNGGLMAQTDDVGRREWGPEGGMRWSDMEMEE